MELRNCPECDRLFTFAGNNLCPKCIEKEEEDFRIIRTYIRKHRGASVTEVAEETGVSESRILNFLKEGRLLSKGLAASADIVCERCGTRIQGGRFCRECSRELGKVLEQSLNTIKGDVASEREISSRRGLERMYIKDNPETGDGEDR